MDRLEAMATLLRVVETGSFSAASRAMGVPLATVSRKVSELETHLGTRLLLRTTRKVSPTEAGAAYAAAARRILADIDETERVAAGEYATPRGELVVTAPVLFGRLHVLPVTADFLAAFPHIDVRLLLSDRNLHLLDEQVDAAVRIGRLPDSALSAARLGATRRVVCANPALLARHGEPGVPQDLAAVPTISFDMADTAPSWSFRSPEAGRLLEIPIRPRLSVSTAEAAVEAAEGGVGAVRVLHYQCADAVRRGALRIVLAAFEPEPLPVHLLHAGRGLLPSKQRVFLDFATPHLRRRLAAL